MCFFLQCRRQRVDNNKTVVSMRDTNCKVTKKVLDMSRREKLLKNMSEIESHMQVIRNRRVDTGVADAHLDTMNRLQERKEFVEELLHPKLWWDCTSCTYRNPPVHAQCEICKSEKPTEITVEMFVNLKALLYNRIDDHKEITRLFTSANEEEARVSVKKLNRTVSELSSQDIKNLGRTNDLENDDTIPLMGIRS